MLPSRFQPAVRGALKWLLDQLSARDEQISAQQARIRELEAQLNQHSGNSSRPPSSDGPQKPVKAQRKRSKGKRSPGGQQGHKGHTLKMIPSDEAIVKDHYPSTCEHCGHSLSDQKSLSYDRSQVFDIPPIAIEVTEHRAHYKACGCCHQLTRGELPSYATNHTVCGPNICALVVYLMVYQMLPYKRCAVLFDALFNIQPSVGTLDNILTRADLKLEDFCQQIRGVLQ